MFSYSYLFHWINIFIVAKNQMQSAISWVLAEGFQILFSWEN